tara:strand:+ start:976 stop:6912 length:5937 start_codon:yes stop_codon:yes gene_type:complete
MFQYNGVQYTLQDVVETANSLGLTLSEYLEKNPEVKEIAEEQDFQNPTAQGAVVEGTAAPDMESPSEDTLLELLNREEIERISKRDFTLQQEINKYGGYASEEERRQKQDIVFKYYADNFEEDGLTYKERTEKRANTSVGKMINSIENAMIRIKGFEPRLTLATRGIFTKILGDEAIDKFVENPNVGDWWKTGMSDDDIRVALNELNRLESLQGRTGSLYDGFKNGDMGELLAGTVNAISSFGSSALIGGMTAGAGIMTDFFSDSFRRINVDKAERLGVDPVDLMNSEDAEFYLPLVLGGLAGAAERFGLKGVSKAINGIKGGAAKKIAGRLVAGTNEATTEYIQGGLEAVEIPLAQKEYEKASDELFKYLSSKEGIESFLQGFVGGAGVTTVATASPTEAATIAATSAAIISPEAVGLLTGTLAPISMRNAASQLRSPQDVKEIDKLSLEIAKLEEQKFNVKDKDIKQNIDAAIASKRLRINEIISNGNQQINTVSESDLNEISSMSDLAKKFNQDINALNKKLRVDKTINKKEFDIARATLLQKFKEDKTNLDKKISDISLKNQNISKKNEDFVKIIKTSKNEAAIEKAKNDLFTNNSGFLNKLINSSFNPNLDTELTKADFTQSINEEFGKLINTYDITLGVPFGAYIQRELPKRIAGIFEAQVETKDGEIIGKTDISKVQLAQEQAIETGKGDIVSELVTEEDLNLESATPITENRMFEKTGLESETINTAAKQILKGKLPGLTEIVARDKNPFLTAVEKASEGKFFESIYKKLGGNLNNTNLAEWKQMLEQDIDDFLSLVEESGNKDYNRIKNKFLKGIYKGKKVGRADMTTGTAAGEGRYEYQTPTREQAIEYFTEGKMTTLVERKKTYTKILAHAVGKKGIKAVIKDPEVQKSFTEIQKLLGKEIPTNIKAKVIERLDRVIKVLETPIKPPGVLTADFGVFIADAVRDIALRIAKGIKLALENGIAFKKAKPQVIKEVASELNLDKKLEKQFIKEVSAATTLEDIITNKFEKNIEKTFIKVTNERFKSTIEVQSKNLKSQLNKADSKQTKQDILFKFFKGISPVYQKSAGNKVWKGQNAKAAYQYWQKELGVNLKELGFTLVKTKFGQSIAFENKIIFAPEGRPSLHKGEYNNEYYENIVDDMDGRSEENKSYILSELDSLLDTDGKQAAIDFISIQGFYSDSPLRLVGKLNKYENKEGKKKYEHTPPIKQIQDEIYDAINSTDNKKEILAKVEKILDRSKVDLITQTSMSKVDKLGRKTTGEGDSRYEGVIEANNLVEIKRSKEKAAETYESRDLNKDFNTIIEDKTGLPADARYSQAVAKRRGKRNNKFNFFVPHSAEDFLGLMYTVLPKGKRGNQALEWLDQNLLHPWAVAMENINRERMQVMNDFKALKRNLKKVPKKLKKPILKGDFTNEDAVRIWIWNSMGITAGDLKLSETIYNQLIDVVNNNPEFLEFAEQLKVINKAEGYPKADKYWNAGNITTDLLGHLNTTKRTKHLEQWQKNVDTIFDEDMFLKLEGEFGKDYVKSLKNILKRMKSGRNNTGGDADGTTSAWLEWINNSVGTIMFLNVRSAVLQTISTINFMNWSDNNPLQAGKAFLNQKQYWKDFISIFNSDYLVERRGGLKLNVAETEIAEMANKGGIRGAISYLLNKGFVLTRMADSFAIANGGAAFYRNRVNTYIKQGMSQKEAETKAFQDFREISEESQQSSRPDRISMQQASPMGRVVLAFGNTPMQYTRIMKRSAQDLAAGRGDWKTNISKIAYYGAIQNFMFNALQKALFAIALDEEEDEEEANKKYTSVAEGMADSIIRGTGVYGAAVVTAKNVAIDIARRAGRARPKFQDSAWKLLTLSPPISSKVSKIRSALYSLDYELDEMKEAGVSLDNPAYMAAANVISASTNIPIDRALRIIDNYRTAVAEDTELWQRIALILGWSSWEIGVEDNDKEQKKESKSIEQQAKDRLKKHLEKFKRK